VPGTTMRRRGGACQEVPACNPAAAAGQSLPGRQARSHAPVELLSLTSSAVRSHNLDVRIDSITFRRCLVVMLFLAGGCSQSTTEDRDAATARNQDGAADVVGIDVSPDAATSDAAEESDAVDDGPKDGDGRDSNLPPRCLGDHGPCMRYSSDNPTFCTEHGCVWQSGACAGTPHPCPTLTQNICNSHEGCMLM